MTRHNLSGLTHLSMSSRMTQARAFICWHVHTHARPYAACFWHENLKSAHSPDQRDAHALDCDHVFHADCLQLWVQQCAKQTKIPTCPYCTTLL